MKTLLTAALVAVALIGGFFAVVAAVLVIATVAFYRRIVSPASVVSPRPTARRAVPAAADGDTIDVVATEVAEDR
ncbi:MAG TPA: hypothetical protein VHE13_17775 [Opitutus sp.]|nr:hypothetical protein [Opitutus sp.]